MQLYDVEADAARVFDIVANGGVAIIPTHVGYAIVGATAAAIRRVFAAKRRRPSKLNAITGCRELHDELHDVTARARSVVAAITEAYDLPLGTVAPYRADHPMIARLDADILEQTTHEGTIAMLLGGGPFLDALGRLSRRHQLAVIGSSANLSLHGTKFRVQDVEPEILAAADEIVDYGLMRWACYGKSSTMLDLRDYRVVRHGVAFELISDLLERHFDIVLAPPDGAGEQ